MKTEFPTAQTSVSVVLATYNEADNIGALLSELLANLPYRIEVIVVDDSSPDGTSEVVGNLLRDDSRIKLIKRQQRGLAAAFHRGILEAKGEIICWMDADMSMPVNVLRSLVEQLADCDVAIGSRYAPGGKDIRHPFRVNSSKLINWFARFVLGGEVRDYDSGFVAIRRCVFDSVTLIPYGYGEYFIEFIYDCIRSGLRIREIGYEFRDRTVGVSKSFPSLISFLRTGSHYAIRILILRLGLFRGGQ